MIASRSRTSTPFPSDEESFGKREEKFVEPSGKISKTSRGPITRSFGRSTDVEVIRGIPSTSISAAEKAFPGRPRGSFATETSRTTNAGGTSARSKPPIDTGRPAASVRIFSDFLRIISWKRWERKTA